MKNSKVNVVKRQQAILQRLRAENSVTMEALSKSLNVSSLTIRRDLQKFEAQGILRCAHGCANLISGSLQNDPGLQPMTEHMISHKEAIARKAAELVVDGDMIFINSSSTAILMLKYIIGKHVVVITNNYKAMSFNLDPKIELILSGGTVHTNKECMAGEMAVSNLAHIAVCKVFLGVSGISAKDGLTTSVLQETQINEMMIKRAGGFCVVLTDGSKVGQKNNFRFGPVKSVTTLITDETADPGELFLLREMGVQVVLANNEEFV